MRYNATRYLAAGPNIRAMRARVEQVPGRLTGIASQELEADLHEIFGI